MATNIGSPESQEDPLTENAIDWKTEFPIEKRERIFKTIMETLKKHLPISVPEGMQELKKIAVRFEEKIYTAATSQSDYLRKISLKMLTMETKTQNTGAPNSNASGSTQNPPDPVHGSASFFVIYEVIGFESVEIHISFMPKCSGICNPYHLASISWGQPDDGQQRFRVENSITVRFSPKDRL
ncbi:hypothetical protein GIB67_031136 [Kingdonia uniflora]|uniref:Mediator complex subunit 15 KIX domain-containing protein n=1 Tax=Kingdonia uniflora TaxID=39325 RepID=A0A7J7MFI4_9MAGN|nr:hypothetical protein GIB67_031136 [Kingdonia uniflora]